MFITKSNVAGVILRLLSVISYLRHEMVYSPYTFLNLSIRRIDIDLCLLRVLVRKYNSKANFSSLQSRIVSNEVNALLHALLRACLKAINWRVQYTYDFVSFNDLQIADNNRKGVLISSALFWQYKETISYKSDIF